MTRILAGLVLLSVVSVPALTPKAEKKSVGAELVPAGTLYSPGVLVGDTLYISGLQGTDPQTHMLPNDFSQEATNCLANVGRVLKDSGMDYSNVTSVQVYLVDISQFEEMNGVYKEYFKSPLPSRTTVQVSKLSLGSHIEIAAIARK
ncbi:MAG TPA: RidA family protein [Candidatus Acidoferrales bacterium]|jgi:2-iminobutanoate/2-iminopropanoate deaminase|nr:RidA family protein [Candidatus Acidoferrales bacterium]